MQRATATWSIRGILLANIIAGLAMAGHLLTTKPALLGINLETYRLAAAALRESAHLYAVSPPGHPQFHWVYPPIVALAFWPAEVLHPTVPIYPLHLTGSLVAGVATGLVTIRVIENIHSQLPSLDRALILGGVTLSPHAVPSLFYGNINPHLVLAVAAALLAAERGHDRRSGAFLAIPALVKVFPAAFGLWLLARRAWQAVAGAIFVGIGTAAVSVLAFGPTLHRTYLRRAVLPRRRTDVFAGGLDPTAGYVTLRRPLSVLFPHSPELIGAGAALIVTVPLALVCRRVDWRTPRGRVLGLHVVIVGVLLALPSYAVYVAFAVPTLVSLCYILPPGTGRTLIRGGTALATVAITLGGLKATVGPGPWLDLLTPVLRLATPQLAGLGLSLVGAVIAAGENSSPSEPVGTP